MTHEPEVDTPREAPLPNVVSAAWELELIIAGAVTFALFQLPGSLDVLRERMMARVDGGALVAVIMAYLYAKVLVYVLLGSFVLNLVARAYWVGLVGLHSVFPRGVQWDQLETGPAFEEIYRKRTASLPDIMARVDNFASVIFSFGFLIVIAFLLSLTSVAVVGGLAYGISALFSRGPNLGVLVAIVSLLYIAPALAITFIDKRIGPTLDVQSVAYTRLRTAALWTSRLTGMGLLAPIMLTLRTNLGRRRIALVTRVVLVGSMVVTMAELFVDLDLVRAGSPAYIPDDARLRGVVPDNYESLRGAGAAVVPTIQSDVVDGPYVRLYIPYVTEPMDEAIHRVCPTLAPLRAARPHLIQIGSTVTRGPARSDSALACLARVYAVAIDGQPQSSPFRFYTQPSSSHRGVIAYLPTAGLAPGAHVLTVERPTRLRPQQAGASPIQPIEIPFWR